MSQTGVLLLEISVIILAVGLVVGVIGTYIYKKATGLPTGECACCHKNRSNLVKQYHKKYCCCDKK